MYNVVGAMLLLFVISLMGREGEGVFYGVVDNGTSSNEDRGRLCERRFGGQDAAERNHDRRGGFREPVTSGSSWLGYQ